MSALALNSDAIIAFILNECSFKKYFESIVGGSLTAKVIIYMVTSVVKMLLASYAYYAASKPRLLNIQLAPEMAITWFAMVISQKYPRNCFVQYWLENPYQFKVRLCFIVYLKFLLDLIVIRSLSFICM
jgi:uncharacterized phage infection (PIP) family protein YhgE